MLKKIEDLTIKDLAAIYNARIFTCKIEDESSLLFGDSSRDRRATKIKKKTLCDIARDCNYIINGLGKAKPFDLDMGHVEEKENA